MKNKAQKYIQEEMERIYKEYKIFLKKKDVLHGLPLGWLLEMEKALKTYSRTGLSLTISKISLHHGTLQANPDRNSSPFADNDDDDDLSLKVFNGLIKRIDSRCVLCGAAEESHKLCKECLQARG